MDGARHGVLGAGLERIRDRVSCPLRHEDDQRRPREPRRGREITHRVREPCLTRAHGEDQQVGRARLGWSLGARDGIGNLGNLESAAH